MNSAKSNLRNLARYVAAVVVSCAAACTSTSAGSFGTSTATTPGASDVAPSSGSTIAISSATPGLASDVIDTPTSTTPSSLEPATQEAADRAAIEAQWAKFWEVYIGIVRTPSEQRSGVLDGVAVDPVKSEMLDAAERFESQGIDYYGFVTQHPYWVAPVGGQSMAVMRDCQDQRQTGTVWVATGETRTSGGNRNSLQAGFVRGSDDIWRVRQFNHLENVPC